MSEAARTRVQDRVASGEFRVVCATNAFGMGIDRPDIEAEGSRDVCPLFIDTPRRVGGSTALCVRGEWERGAASVRQRLFRRTWRVGSDNGHSVNRVTGAS